MSQESKGAFSRVAVVNRGEPAMRLINAAREWNAEGRPALRVIAVYTAADRHATFVREADEAVLIGPAVVLDAYLGGQPVEVIGFESRPLPRHGFYPMDGPSQWTAGTLFPARRRRRRGRSTPPAGTARW